MQDVTNNQYPNGIDLKGVAEGLKSLAESTGGVRDEFKATRTFIKTEVDTWKAGFTVGGTGGIIIGLIVGLVVAACLRKVAK